MGGVDGGGGRDIAGYNNSLVAVIVNNSTGTVGGVAPGRASDGDTLVNIEGLRGSTLFGDWLIGGNPVNDAFESFDGRGGSG